VRSFAKERNPFQAANFLSGPRYSRFRTLSLKISVLRHHRIEAFNNNDPWDRLLSDSEAYILSAACWVLVLAIVVGLATIIAGPFVSDPADSSTLIALMSWLGIIAMVALATTLSFESATKQREAAGEHDH